MITTPEKDPMETEATDHASVTVPITQPLHFMTPAAQHILDPQVRIVDAVAIGERPEATLVAEVTTQHGKMEALIRVPREDYIDGNLAGRTQARFSADLRALVF
jgi:hypothetical protein